VETGVVNTDPKKTNVKLLASVDDKENLYLTWVQFDAFPSQDNSCTSVVQFSRSSNGKKWSSPTRLNQDAGNCLDGDNSPSKAFPAISSDERVFSAWSINGRIFLDRSYDGGSTWLSNDIGITNQPGGKNFDIPGLDKYEASPSIILDRSRSQYQGFLYLAWADQHSGQNDTDVWFIRSNNGGDNWTSVLRVNDDDPGKHQYAPTLAMDYSTGIVYVAYFDRRAYEDNQTDVYVAYSMDGGTSFNNVKVTSAPFIADQTLLNSLSMTAMKSTLAITWSQSDGTSPRLLTIVLKHDELVIEGDKQKK
jgi:hypothetical protein